MATNEELMERLQAVEALTRSLVQLAARKPSVSTNEYKVELTYFKPSGKYYSSGSYTTFLANVNEIHEEFQGMFNNGHRPGLADGFGDLFALVTVPGHEQDYPVVIFQKGMKVR